jgi:hypothetical protein
MLNLLLATSTAFMNQCQYNISFLNYDGWINITALVVLITLFVSAMVYAFSGILPGNTRERVRGVVKYEYIQGVFSVILIVILFAMSLTACDMAGLLTQSATASTAYQDPFQFANGYVGTLLFVKGIALTTGMFQAGVTLVIDSFFVNYVLSLAGSFTNAATPILGKIGGTTTPAIANSDQPAAIIYDYSSVLNYLLEPIVVVVFGLLFVVFLALPAIETLALTLVIPVAIVMRSLAFTGPRLREASNALIALSIAFYFVFPLTLAMNFYVVNWTYCNGVTNCNPYSSYLGPYTVNSLALSQLFTNSEVQNLPGFSGLSLPENFYAAVIQSHGGFSAAARQVVTGFTKIPEVINDYVESTAQYLFQALFLIGLDVAITIGFAVGLHKGLESMGQLFGAGPFWSG